MRSIKRYRGVLADSGTGTLAAIAFGWFITLGMRFLLPAVLPRIKVTYGIDNTTAGLAITAVWAGYAIMQFPAGVLVDRLNERILLSLSLLLAGASLTVISAAPIFPLFFAGTGLFGLATGLFGTTRGIALSNFFSPNPDSAFGITLAAGSIGSAALPFLASLLVDDLGWRAIVGASVPLFLLTVVGTWWSVPASRGAGDDRTALSLERVREAVADRAIVVSVVALTLMVFTFQAMTAFLPTYLVQEKGLTEGTAGALFGMLFVAGAGFQIAGGRAVERFGTKAVLVAIAAVGIFPLAALPAVGGVIPLAVLIAVMSMRLAISPVANAYVIGVLPDEARGTVWGLLRSGFFLVSSAGSAVVGVLSDYGLFDEAFFLLGGLTAVGAVLFAFLPRRSGR